MKKRVFSILLVLVMILGMIPATTLTASAASDTTVSSGGAMNLTFDYNGYKLSWNQLQSGSTIELKITAPNASGVIEDVVGSDQELKYPEGNSVDLVSKLTELALYSNNYCYANPYYGKGTYTFTVMETKDGYLLNEDTLVISNFAPLVLGFDARMSLLGVNGYNVDYEFVIEEDYSEGSFSIPAIVHGYSGSYTVSKVSGPDHIIVDSDGTIHGSNGGTVKVKIVSGNHTVYRTFNVQRKAVSDKALNKLVMVGFGDLTYNQLGGNKKVTTFRGGTSSPIAGAVVGAEGFYDGAAFIYDAIGNVEDRASIRSIFGGNETLFDVKVYNLDAYDSSKKEASYYAGMVDSSTPIKVGRYAYIYHGTNPGYNDYDISDYKIVDYYTGETLASETIDFASFSEYFISPTYYVYDVKPEIHSVSVNGTSVADGGAVTANNGNVTIKTNYDSKLSDALTAYGCSVKQLSAYYLNGEKINVAALTPVDNGDGTATKTYSRYLTAGDELRVESWLEVKWPDGSTDRVDEHTVTVSRPSIAFDFANQNPVGSADETTGLSATSGDTKSYTFGSTAVPSGYYVEKKATLKGLFAGLDADQTVTVKDGSATLTHTFIKPGLYQLTETLKLYENGSTKVIATKSHQFLIEVAAADPAFVTQPHYEGKGMQTGTNYVSWKLNFTPVKLIARCNLGTYARPNWKEYELDPTKSFAALVAYSQKYVLYAYYGEGDRDYVASEAFSAEKPAEFTPAFTKQPVGDQSLGGNPVEVTWATNFVPVKISIMQGSGVKPTMEHSVLDDATATSTLLGASENNYFICAYYSDTEYVTSNKFKITELAPAFTLQPADGVSLGGAYAETSWATNFTPVKLQLMKYDESGFGRPFYWAEDLDVNATSCTVEPGHDYYRIYAYYNDTQYVFSDQFYVTEMNYYNAWFYVDDTVLDKVMVLEGDYVERPADPIKDGYKFLGWYTDDGEAYNFAAPVTDDVHLTARFEEVEVVYHVVKFMVDDSEWYSCAVAEGEPVSAPTVPEKDGYKFLGWSYEGAYYEFKAPVFGDMILYAEYEKIVTGHTVAFHLGTDPVGWQEVEDGATAEKPEDPAQEGKVFLGWYTAYVGGEKFDFSTPITGDLNLYARFEDAPVGGHIPGDVNNDGEINVRDYGLLQQYLNDWDVTLNLDAADVTGDGEVNVRDYGLLQQYLNDWDVELK